MPTLNLIAMTSALTTDGFTHSVLDVASETSEGGEMVENWAGFADSWNRLLPDQYMADGGKYRLRRYSEFLLHAGQKRAVRTPHVAYSQTKSVNRLNGGVVRLYEPFETDTADSQMLRLVFSASAGILEAVDPGKQWRAQCFQNRILASDQEAGLPTPEGIHRDGTEWVLTLFVDRVGADGGESGVYRASDRRKLASVQLKQPGEFLFVNDLTLLHDVTPLSVTSGARAGFRDVFIAMFSEAKNAGLR